MFGQKNVSKWLQKQKLFGYTITLAYCKLRKKNFKILKVNTGFKLTEDQQYILILHFVEECRNLQYFRRIEFKYLFNKPETPMEEQLQEYWVFKMVRDLKNKHILQATGDLCVCFY